MKKLYVGNLPYSATEDKIRSLFSQYGNIEDIALIKDFETGRIKGFCFIEYEKQTDAEKALELHGKDFEGRTLKVNIAKPKESSGGRTRNNRDSGYKRRW